MLFLSERDVEALLPTVDQVIAEVERTLRAHGERTVIQAPKAGLHPAADALFHALAAMSPSLGAAGVKWVSYFGGNAARGLPGSSALLILNDHLTGLPFCLMEGVAMTRERTGACAAVAAKYLARQDAEVLTLVGSGPVALACAPYIAAAVPSLKAVRVSARSEASAVRGAELLVSQMREVDVVGFHSVEAAVAGADIVVSAIGHPPVPPLLGPWLRPGMLALPLEGEAAWESSVFHEADMVVADDAEVLQSGFRHTRPGDSVPEVHAELGQIVAELAPGRTSDTQRIIDSNNGIGILDVALGQLIHAQALEHGVGRSL